MMKSFLGKSGVDKKKVIVLILVTTFGLCACGRQENISNENQGKTTEKEQTQNQTEATEEPQTQNQTEITEEPQTQNQGETGQADSLYKVNLVQGTKTKDGNINVVYPQIEGWENSQAQERWNEKLNFDFQKDQDEPGIEEYEEYKVKTTIMTQTDELLSFFVEGAVYYKEAAYPSSWVRGFSINMSTGESYGLGDCSDEELRRITEALLKKEYTIKSDYKDIKVEEIPAIADLFVSNQGEEEVSLDDQRISRELKKCGWDLYRINNTIGLVFEVNHALGDYVILEIVSQ